MSISCVAGWYTTGEGPTEEEISIQRQICEINESPLFLQLNPGETKQIFSEEENF